MAYLDIKDLQVGDKVWACAYDFHNNKDSMSYKQLPVLGMIRGNCWNLHGETEDTKPRYFIPFKKNHNTSFATSKIVDVTSRKYASSYEECANLYNELVNEKIKYFVTRAEETKKDLIVG